MGLIANYTIQKKNCVNLMTYQQKYTKLNTKKEPEIKGGGAGNIRKTGGKNLEWSKLYFIGIT